MLELNELQVAIAAGLEAATAANVQDISIDIETLGTQPGAPIVAIGLAGFCRKTGVVYPLMYVTIDLQSAITCSDGVDPSTLGWWFKQSQDAIDQTFNDTDHRVGVFDAALQVIAVFQKLGNPRPWGNGASFDITLLEALFAKSGFDVPWAHWDVRDVRTVVDLGRSIMGYDPKKEMPFEGTRHNALADAEHQAKYTVAILRALNDAYQGV